MFYFGICLDLPDTILNLPPSDEMLDKLALRIGKKWMELSLELGLDIEQLEYIEYDSPNVLRDISKTCYTNGKKKKMAIPLEISIMPLLELEKKEI